MLPTKGYFQDIECPYYDSSCGRPYCHFRHRKKPTENIEEIVSESEKDEITTIPTYKPTPKSELANIHNKSHIPISYVPDLAFRSDRKLRPFPKFDKPTYKPTPLSILSSANKRGSLITEENGEHTKAIKEIKQNIANVEYNPTLSLQSTVDIDFEDLSTEFDLIDEIINSGDKTQRKIESSHENIAKILEGKPEAPNDNTNVNKPEIKTEIHNCIKEEDVKKLKVAKSNIEKIYDNSEKYNDKISEKRERNREKYSEKGINKLDSDRREKSSEKHVMNEKSKKNKYEKDSDKAEKDKKTKSTKSKEEKHKTSDKEKSSSSKERSTKEKSEKSLKDKSHKNSDQDKHRKEEKKDRNSEKHSSHKNKHKSKDRSRSRSKERKKSREREKGKEKRCDKDRNSKNRLKDGGSSKDRNQKRKHESMTSRNDKRCNRRISGEESSDSTDDNFPMFTNNIEDNLSDLDFDDEDETMLECYKIFNEYKPPEKRVMENMGNMSLEEDSSATKDEDIESVFGKKRIAHANAESNITYSKIQPPSKPKLNSPGQILANRYKIAKLAQASKEQEFIMNEIKQPTVPSKRPAPTLLEAARERKLRKEQSQLKIAETGCLVDNIIKGTIKPNVAQQKIIIKKIAPAQNVGLMEKAKERLSKLKQIAQTKTIAQTQKTGRVAHVPEVSLSDIPDVLHAEKSKLPVNVRTRFLTMIADECVKLYISKEEAFTRALNEEFSCYEKCKVITTYRNSAMLAVNRLRKEIQERQKLGLGLINLGEDPTRDSSSDFIGENFYNHVKKWILTEEELDIHGYPRESEQHHGRAVIKNRKNIKPSNIDENQRTCCRCHKIYPVDDDGWPLFEEECLYHPLKKRTIKREQTYLCCRSNDGIGCATSDTHVSESVDDSELEGFQTTMEPDSDNDARNYAVYALDCEMCYTTKGLELTRVSIVDSECKTIYESLVKPLNPIIDYNTRFSGITKEQMDKTSTSILQIQANILHLCNSRTILVGHSLESDMKALKIVHGTIIDTSVLFPHKMGLPHKRALKALASEYLRKLIQNDVSGHDSAEDAITCMELIKWKLKDELKVRGSK